MINVLIAAKDKDFSQGMSSFLFSLGFKVSCVSSGPDALDQFGQLKPDLVFLDSELSGPMSGSLTLEKIRRSDPGSFVIMFSEAREEAAEKHFTKHGAIDYFSKPVDLNSFKKAVLTWSARAQLKRLKDKKAVVFELKEEVLDSVLEIFKVKDRIILQLFKPSDIPEIDRCDLVCVRADKMSGQDLGVVLSNVYTKFSGCPVLIVVSDLAEKRVREIIDKQAECEYLLSAFSKEEMLLIICGMIAGPREVCKNVIERRVLIIDDDKNLTDSLEVFLAGQGYEAFSVNDPLQAVQAAERIDPNIILLDIIMPRTDGLEVLEKIRKKLKAVKVVMMTAVKDDFVCKEAMRLGACDYLVKPFSLDQLKITLLLCAQKAG